jgi:TatD DNase family protein
MIDSHCHLTHNKFAADVDGVIARAHAAGVAACVTIGTGIEDAIRARALARRHEGFVFATAGLDPFSSHAAGSAFDGAYEALDRLLAEGGFVGLGEIGLDYHYDLDPRALQAERFERQLDLAARLDLPVVIHVREAHDDMAAILKLHPRNRGVIHSFTGGPADAERYLAIGWHLAFNGVVTFKNTDALRAAARVVPPDRILVETDSPYLAPQPVRGKRNEPAYVVHTVAALAEARGETLELLAALTHDNAAAAFGLG